MTITIATIAAQALRNRTKFGQLSTRFGRFWDKNRFFLEISKGAIFAA